MAACAQCGPGTYSGVGAAVCSACGAGSFSAAGATGCGACLAGSSCASLTVAPVQCPANTFSAASAASCTACPSGQTALAGASMCTAYVCDSPSTAPFSGALAFAVTSRNVYYNNENCAFTVVVRGPPRSLRLAFSSFRTETSYDFLWVTTPAGWSSPRWSGSSTPATLTLPASATYVIRFTSDSSVTDAGASFILADEVASSRRLSGSSALNLLVSYDVSVPVTQRDAIAAALYAPSFASSVGSSLSSMGYGGITPGTSAPSSRTGTATVTAAPYLKGGGSGSTESSESYAGLIIGIIVGVAFYMSVTVALIVCCKRHCGCCRPSSTTAPAAPPIQCASVFDSHRGGEWRQTSTFQRFPDGARITTYCSKGGTEGVACAHETGIQGDHCACVARAGAARESRSTFTLPPFSFLTSRVSQTGSCCGETVQNTACTRFIFDQGVHGGEWRQIGRKAVRWPSRAAISTFCSLDGDDGAICTHGVALVKVSHWSCCGATDHRSAVCAREQQVTGKGGPLVVRTVYA